MTPQPKLFQLFHPSGGVTAGLPGAAPATGWCAGEKTTDNTVASAIAAANRRARHVLGRAGIVAPSLA
ncbi:hypothetical protein GCM10027199_61230 [Amycolatopsis magusensis]